jgi:guanylate cyclase soluble subunit beta
VEKLEETSNNLKKIESKLIDHKKKTDDLLHSILPKEVAAKLRLNQPVPAESYKVVTILFSDIVGFTALCSSDQVVPMDIVKLLNKLYTYFDMLSGMNDVYKVREFTGLLRVTLVLYLTPSVHAIHFFVYFLFMLQTIIFYL